MNKNGQHESAQHFEIQFLQSTYGINLIPKFSHLGGTRGQFLIWRAGTSFLYKFLQIIHYSILCKILALVESGNKGPGRQKFVKKVDTFVFFNLKQYIQIYDWRRTLKRAQLSYFTKLQKSSNHKITCPSFHRVG